MYTEREWVICMFDCLLAWSHDKKGINLHLTKLIMAKSSAANNVVAIKIEINDSDTESGKSFPFILTRSIELIVFETR